MNVYEPIGHDQYFDPRENLVIVGARVSRLPLMRRRSGKNQLIRGNGQKKNQHQPITLTPGRFHEQT